jgi:cytochrome b6-f complex iron-sulfur subunit
MRSDHSDTGVSNKRRHFLGRSLQWTGGLLSLLLIYPLLRFLGFTIKPKPRYITVSAPLPLSGYHAERDFILFAGENGTPFAVSRTCTHLGCRVNFLEDRQIIECPCHQSRFTPHGKLIAGPAKKNLSSYKVETKETPEGVVSGYVITL